MVNRHVIILGSGLSGMITALTFAKNRINVTIVEANDTDSATFLNDVRTTALTAYSKQYFEANGLWNLIKDHVGPINDIYVVDNKEPEILHFASSIIEEQEVMGYLIKNNDLKSALLTAVKKNPFIKLIDQTVYKKIDNADNYVIVYLPNDQHIKADLIIVCDGYNSPAKKLFFTPKLEKNYGQHALTFIVRHEKSHEGTAVEHFMPSGPFAILPLRDPYNSSIVWTAKSSRAEALINLEKEEFEYLVQENFGPFLGKVEIEGIIASFPLRTYETENYYYKRAILLADTAHIIHPLAGQGLNQGIKDIEVLIDLINIHGITPIALTNYQALRQQDNHHMLTLTDTLNTLFSNSSIFLRKTRQLGFHSIEKISPFKKALIKYAIGKR